MKRFFLNFSVVLFFLIPSATVAQEFSVQPVSLEEALEKAPQEGKKILVDVYATWCPYCQRMESEVYPSEDVQQAISEYFVWVRIDVESQEKVNYFEEQMTEAEFAKALDNQNVPTVYFLNGEGAILGSQPGYLKEDVFARLLTFVGSNAYLSQSFEEFRGDE